MEAWRRDSARRRREENDARREAPPPEAGADTDDTLALLLLCCHPALRPPSQVALTLRAVGGLTTAEIAHGLLLPEPTVAQRISRAKARLADGLARPREVFAPPTEAQRRERVPAVLAVLSLVFTEGHTATAGEAAAPLRPHHRGDPAHPGAARRAPARRGRGRGGGGPAGAHAAHRCAPARAGCSSDGALVPLAEQDRTRWDAAMIAEGTALVTAVLRDGVPGPYSVQAAIAALHDEAADPADTDWPQILALYDTLVGLWPESMSRLGRLVALGEVHGPDAALAELAALADDPGLRDHHRVAAVRAHLEQAAGRREPGRGRLPGGGPAHAVRPGTGVPAGPGLPPHLTAERPGTPQRRGMITQSTR